MKELENKLVAFLKDVSNGLTESDVENAKDFINHSEYGVAFELICDQLYENDSILTADNLKSAQLLAEMMELDEKSWSFLKENFQ
ncbi:MafI family immunity protein [Thalassotalea fusca]